MMIVNGLKFACSQCIKGHRTSRCSHSDRELIEIKAKGRPVTQCAKCIEMRELNGSHLKCDHEEAKPIPNIAPKRLPPNKVDPNKVKSTTSTISTTTTFSSTKRPLDDLLFTPTTAGTHACFCGDSCSCSGCSQHDPKFKKSRKSSSSSIFSSTTLHGRLDEDSGCRCGSSECVGNDPDVNALLLALQPIDPPLFQSINPQFQLRPIQSINSEPFQYPVTSLNTQTEPLPPFRTLEENLGCSGMYQDDEFSQTVSKSCCEIICQCLSSCTCPSHNHSASAFPVS